MAGWSGILQSLVWSPHFFSSSSARRTRPSFVRRTQLFTPTLHSATEVDVQDLQAHSFDRHLSLYRTQGLISAARRTPPLTDE